MGQSSYGVGKSVAKPPDQPVDSLRNPPAFITNAWLTRRVSHMKNYYNPFMFLCICFLPILLACGGKGALYEPPPPAPEPYQVREVRLRPGDKIHLRFFYQPELDGIQEIRGDGKISLQLIGEKEAAGLTVNEFRRELTVAFKNYFELFDVAVILVDSAKKSVYISGAVPINQMLNFEEPLTVTQAIIRAGGFPNTAKLANVLVLRHQGTSQLKVFSIDVKNSLQGGGADFYLQDRDVVYVPAKKITKVNSFVSQYIDGIIPKHVAAAFGFSYPLRGVDSDVDVQWSFPSD